MRRRPRALTFPIALIRAYDVAGNVIETHEHIGDFKECWRSVALLIDAVGGVAVHLRVVAPKNYAETM